MTQDEQLQQDADRYMESTGEFTTDHPEYDAVRQAYMVGRSDQMEVNYQKANEVVADIRNKLGPFWTLVDIVLANKEVRFLKTDGWDIVSEANKANDQKMYIVNQLEELRKTT